MTLAERSTTWDDDGFFQPFGPYGDGHYDDRDGSGRPWARWLLSAAMLGAVGVLLLLGLPEVRHRAIPTTADAEALDASLTAQAALHAGSAPLAFADPAATGLVGPADGSPSTTADATAADATGAGTNLAGAAGTPAAPNPAGGAPTGATTPATAPASTATTARPATTATTARPSTTAAPATAAPGGGCWKLVKDDEFNGSSLDTSLWSAYNSAGNGGNGLRRPSAISVGGGLLTITAQMQNGQLVSGGMGMKYSQQYGRYEVRVRTDADPSSTMSGVVMTWPSSDNQPRDGENDLYETTTNPGDRHQFYSFIHKPGGSSAEQDYTIHPASGSSWHTVAMEWRADTIRIYRDGALVKTLNETSANRIPDNNHFAAIQLDAFGGSLPGTVTMQVDYIKVWSAC